MSRVKKVYVQYYCVDWILSNGHCYRTTDGMTWKDVLEAKRTAKMLGETIKYEKTERKCYNYSY